MDFVRAREIVLTFLCGRLGHRFEEHCDGLKRTCSRCDREEWVMSRSYPLIGEVKYYWKHMDWRRPF